MTTMHETTAGMHGGWTLGQSLTSGPLHDLFFRQPAGTVSGEGTDWMFMWIFWFSMFWFVLLMLLMVFFVIRYRRARMGPVAPRSSAHNTPLEIAWTVIPSLFLVFIFFKGFWTYIDKLVAPADAMEVKIIASRWTWAATYPSGAESPLTTTIGARPIPVFYLPAGKPVKFRYTSSDVMHAVWIPDFRVKQDALPNRYMNVWFKTKPLDGKKTITQEMLDKDANPKQMKGMVGAPYEDHWLFCAEYCGDEHSEMAAILRFVPEDYFNTWLGLLDEIANSGNPVEAGQRIYKARCASCHSVDGSKVVGPSWKDLYMNPAIPLADGASVLGDANYIRESIRVPAAKVHQGFPPAMTAFPPDQLKDKDIDRIIEYMKTISTHTPPGEMPKPAN